MVIGIFAFLSSSAFAHRHLFCVFCWITSDFSNIDTFQEMQKVRHLICCFWPSFNFCWLVLILASLNARQPLKDRCFMFWRAVVLAVFFFESWRCAQTNLFRIVRIITDHPSLLHSLRYDARVSYCEYDAANCLFVLIACILNVTIVRLGEPIRLGREKLHIYSKAVRFSPKWVLLENARNK